MAAAKIHEYEKVQIADVNNGQRFETYVIAGAAGSGIICLNGAAAREVQVADKVIIMSYTWLSEADAAMHQPTVVLVDANNHMTKVAHYEKHGKLIN